MLVQTSLIDEHAKETSESIVQVILLTSETAEHVKPLDDETREEFNHYLMQG